MGGVQACLGLHLSVPGPAVAAARPPRQPAPTPNPSCASLFTSVLLFCAPLLCAFLCAPHSLCLRTGILIGVHGAALTFVTSTAAGESALLELAGVGWEDTQTGNMLNLFPSLAHNMGAYYEQVRVC